MRLASLIFALVMIVAIGVIAYFTEAGVMDSRTWVLHTYEVKANLGELQSTLNEVRASAGLYLLSNDKAELLHFREQASQMRDLAKTLAQLTEDNPRQQEHLNTLRPLLDTQVSQLEGCVDGRQNLTLQPPEMLEALKAVVERSREIRAGIRTMQDGESHLLQIRLDTWDALFKRNLITLGVAFALATILLIYNFRFLLAEIALTRETEKIERENAESYRALSARILELQDVERRKIARELHDSVGQYLTGLKLNLGQLLAGNSPALSANPALLSETIDLTDRAIGEVRTISHLLHPPLLDELGFESAARWYGEGFSKRSGIEVRLKAEEIAERLPREIELAFFRVLQEALTNVHRHANARSVDVEITCTGGKAILVVRDDGKGMPQEVLLRFRAGLAGGMGLAGMRERLTELDGSLEVSSTASGSVLRATLPVVTCDSNNAEPLNTLT